MRTSPANVLDASRVHVAEDPDLPAWKACDILATICEEAHFSQATWIDAFELLQAASQNPGQWVTVPTDHWSLGDIPAHNCMELIVDGDLAVLWLAQTAFSLPADHIFEHGVNGNGCALIARSSSFVAT